LNTTQKIPVPVELLSQVVDFAEVSSLATKRAMDEAITARQAREKAAALAPTLLAHMVKAGAVHERQLDAARAMLGGHDTTMQLLKAAVDKIAQQDVTIKQLQAGQKQAGDLGRGEDAPGTPAPGEYNSLTSPLVGEKTAELKESDKVLLRFAKKQ
jgi:hypothetical protein